MRFREIATAMAVAAALAMAPLTGVRAAEPIAEGYAGMVHAELASQLPVMAPRAIAWAEKLAASAQVSGVALTPRQIALAKASGVREPASIRLLPVDRIPLPDEPALKAAALSVGLSQASAAGMTVGYAVVVRREYADDVRLLSHEFRHVAQYEASGGIRAFLGTHLAHLAEFGYRDSPFEVDARAHERTSWPE